MGRWHITQNHLVQLKNTILSFSLCSQKKKWSIAGSETSYHDQRSKTGKLPIFMAG
jgi:hypothetical protein